LISFHEISFITFIRDISAGMASIQSLGIVHLDLKSANVLLEQIQTGENEYELNGKLKLK